jgi:alpha-glucoside transport system permease protein
MTTPPVLDDHRGPMPRPPEEIETTNGFTVWLLRFGSAFVVPAVLVVFFFAFSFLKDDSVNKLLQVVVALVVGILGVWALFWGMDQLVNLLPRRAATAVRPFAFVGPAIVLLGFYLVYPAVNTAILSLQDARSKSFIGFDNYVTVFTKSQYLISIRNSILWVLVVPFLAVAVG